MFHRKGVIDDPVRAVTSFVENAIWGRRDVCRVAIFGLADPC
jgi:hypothetical protein